APARAADAAAAAVSRAPAEAPGGRDVEHVPLARAAAPDHVLRRALARRPGEPGAAQRSDRRPAVGASGRGRAGPDPGRLLRGDDAGVPPVAGGETRRASRTRPQL